MTRKEIRTYWSEELIKACESVMNSEQYKAGYDWMTIEKFRDELRQLTRDGKEKELETLRKEKSQEVNRKFEAIKALTEPQREGGNMKKIFISCPMKGRTKEEIKKTIIKMHKYAELVLEEKCGVIPSYITPVPPSEVSASIWRLGDSIHGLSEADVFVGLDAPYWVDAKGCIIEDNIARSYGIKRLMISGDAFEYFCPDVKNEPHDDVPVCGEV